MSDLKICRNCVHFHPYPTGGCLPPPEASCSAPQSPSSVDPVYGHTHRSAARNMRVAGLDTCGPDGRWFEPKPEPRRGFWARVLRR